MATTVFNSSTVPSSITNSGGTGYGAVVGQSGEGLGKAITDSSNALGNSLATLDASDPGQLIAVQQQMGVFNVALSVMSSLIKSLEDAGKGIAQKMG